MGLKDLRLAKGYSRTELAKVSGIRYQKIRDIEVGIIKPENITLKRRSSSRRLSTASLRT